MPVSESERFAAVNDGILRFGWDFFMVDSRPDVAVHACSFHIQEEKDRSTFAQFASPSIPWAAQRNADFSAQAKSSAEKFYDLIVSGDSMVGMIS
jgi:hypothetical protein